MMTHCLAIDYEAWNGHSEFSHLSSSERRVGDREITRRQGYALLEAFRRRRMCVTWFVTGEVAEWYPDVIEAIVQDRHELGYHTHTHPPRLTPEILAQELRASEPFLARYRPRGFRAPGISIPATCYVQLQRAGFAYSSSTYGDTASPITVDGICEVPVSTRRYWGVSAPYGSGAFLMFERWVARQIRDGERRGTWSNLFVHNWQLFEPTPEERVFHHRLLRKRPWRLAYWLYFYPTWRQLMVLLDEFTFGRLGDAVPMTPGDPRHGNRAVTR